MFHSSRYASQSAHTSTAIYMKNFGPISEGQIDLKPLTILIGPNNSGKSYAAMFVHSILSSGGRNDMMHPHMRYHPHAHPTLYDEYMEEFEQIIKENVGRDSFDIPQPFIVRVFEKACNIAGSRIKSQLERNFGCQLDGLVKNGASFAHFDIKSPQAFTIRLDSTLEIKHTLPFTTQYRIETTSDRKRVGRNLVTASDNGNTVVITAYKLRSAVIAYEIFECITRSISDKIMLGSDASYYLPASRSGILQGHKALTAGIIQSAEFAGMESINVPKLTGAVSDFISRIILLQGRTGDAAGMAEQMERDMLGGRIRLDHHTGVHNAMPEVTYVTDDGEFPLHRASSTVSEIAPLSLYMKHIIDKDCLLIIEEPESHLHPKNQIILAKYIVKMIRSGLRVLLTTHSEFLLEKLGMFVAACDLNPPTRSEILDADAEDFIRPYEVSVHAFGPDESGSIRIRPLEADADLGISQEEFADISQTLHNDSIRLEEYASKAS